MTTVVLETVSDETEAELVCGLLREAGIECGHRVTEAVDSPLHGFTGDGPREILVDAARLKEARYLLDAQLDTSS